MKKSDFKIGQKVYLEYVGSSRYGNKGNISTTKVEKVGNKYVTVLGNRQFHISDGREKTDFSASHRLYLSLEELQKKVDKDKLLEEGRSFFSSYLTNEKSNVFYLTPEEVEIMRAIFKKVKSRKNG